MRKKRACARTTQKARKALPRYISPGVRNGLEKRSYASTAYATNISASALRPLLTSILKGDLERLALFPARSKTPVQRAKLQTCGFSMANRTMLPGLASSRSRCGCSSEIGEVLELSPQCNRLFIYRRIAVLRWCRNCGGFAVKLRVAVGYLMSSHCFIRFWVISPLLCMCENVVSAWRSLTFATFIILVIASL
jgi:hypothetical protein